MRSSSISALPSERRLRQVRMSFCMPVCSTGMSTIWTIEKNGEHEIYARARVAAIASSGDRDHGRAAQASPPQVVQRLLRGLQRIGLDLRAHGHARGEGQELLRVGARQVRDRAQDALLPEQLVGEGWDL